MNFISLTLAILLPSLTDATTTCTSTTGVILGTGSIKSLPTSSPNTCCAECYAYGYKCKGYTFESTTSTCFLKDNVKTSTPSRTATSGAPSSQPPLPPNHTTTTRACLPGQTDHFPFCNVSLSIEQRVENLISLLKDDEIPPLLTAREGGGGSPGPPGNVSRIGLPEYDWGVNCIHGVQTTCGTNTNGTMVCPSSFPNPNALGASFNRSMFLNIGGKSRIVLAIN